MKHRIRVHRKWLEQGEAIELELPRNLACAKCDGGGCDTCEGAGALSLRGRRDPAEVVRLVLPRTLLADADSRRAVALRIPEKGGPSPSVGVPRGMLILTVVAADATDSGVRRVHPSLVPPAGEPARRLSYASLAPGPGGISWPLVVVAAVAIWILLLAILRAAGAF